MYGRESTKTTWILKSTPRSGSPPSSLPLGHRRINGKRILAFERKTGDLPALARENINNVYVDQLAAVL